MASENATAVCASCGAPFEVKRGRREKCCSQNCRAHLRSPDPRGYSRVYIGKRHPWSNSGGWCWRHRLVAMEAMTVELQVRALEAGFPVAMIVGTYGPKLRPSDHVHHERIRRGRPGADVPQNLSIAEATYHGQLHAKLMEWAGCRDQRTGRFVAFHRYEWPSEPKEVPRYAAIIGPAAEELSVVGSQHREGVTLPGATYKPSLEDGPHAEG